MDFYNIKTREFAIQNQNDGIYYSVGYPIYFCIKVHLCKNGLRVNQGCTSKHIKLCPGRAFYLDTMRKMSKKEIKQMFNQENNWINIKGVDEYCEEA